jgi:hypothetical protein
VPRDTGQVAVINPAHAKALKGHKTDAKDALRLAELFECGLLRGSYIPPQALKDLRDLTRYRTKTVQARTSEIQRLAKALESAGIKLDSVVSQLTGKSATAMIEALIDGERRGQVLADLAIGRLRTAGKLASHEKLASWVTLCPGNHTSAGKRKHGRTGDAGTYIKPMLVQAAWSAIKTQGRLQARYHKLVRRFGGPKNPAAVKKAILAIAHTLLKIAYQVLKSGKPYEDLGADFYTKRESPDQRRAYLLRQLEKLSPGCTITITPRGGRLKAGTSLAIPLIRSRGHTGSHPGPPHGRAHNSPRDPSPTSRARVRCRAPC